MVSFHNFNSQNFKLSVSDPKSRYVADLSVLSQISNCQSLGRKNKHDILKTDRTRSLQPPFKLAARNILLLLVLVLLLLLVLVLVLVL